MPKFIVRVPVVKTHRVEVEAKNAAAAVNKVLRDPSLRSYPAGIYHPYAHLNLGYAEAEEVVS